MIIIDLLRCTYAHPCFLLVTVAILLFVSILNFHYPSMYVSYILVYDRNIYVLRIQLVITVFTRIHSTSICRLYIVMIVVMHGFVSSQVCPPTDSPVHVYNIMLF